MTFGETVSNRRRELGIQQNVLAKAIGISPGMLSKIENGTRKPSAKIANNITKVLRMDDAPDANYLTGDAEVDLEILEKRVTNAIYELEIILNIVRDLKGNTSNETSI